MSQSVPPSDPPSDTGERPALEPALTRAALSPTTPTSPTPATALLVEGQARGFRDAMDLLIQACDQALADARLAHIGATDSPLQRLVDDLQREKAAALRSRAIVAHYISAAVTEIREVGQATGDIYMLKIAAALEADDYRDLAPYPRRLPAASTQHAARSTEDSMSQQTGPQEPQWQPSSQVFKVGTMIDGMLSSARDQYALLQEACPKPHVLDDATVGRVVRVYTDQRDDLWLYDEQLRRWTAEPLKAMRRREVERLQGQMARLHETIDAILVLAEELGRGTIERVLEKDDAELGLE